MRVQPAEWFGISVLFLFLAHVLRAARQGTLFPKKYAVRRFDLLLGLAIGYALNAIVPLRVGEAIRVFYVGRRCRIRYSFVAATVLAERLSDLILVGLLYAGFAVVEKSWSGFGLSIAVLLGGALVAILFAVATNRSSNFRRAIWIVASLFNQQIRSGLLDVCWSFSELVTGGTIFKGRFLFISPMMWALYLASYWSFAKVIGAQTKSVVSAMLGSPLHSTVESIGKLHVQQFQRNTLPFVLVPVFLIIVYGLLREYTSIFRVFNSLLTGRYLATLAYSAPISDRFHEAAEYEAFLVSMFSNEDSLLTDFSLAALADGAVQRLFPGGSDAVTALVQVDDTLLIRKFAVGKAAAKLRVQAEWLKAHKGQLPVVEIIGSKDVRVQSFAYDMPYIPEAVDFYDTIHTAPFERSREILTDVIDRMLSFHANGRTADAREETVERYIGQKVMANAEQALSAFAEYATDDSGRYVLNGREYSLNDWNVLRDAKWLRQQITDLRCSTVHGDLTVENIIVSKNHPSGFYIIDPNSENIFDTPLIDWAKLMQSLHLGYESLNRMPECKWRNGELSLLLPRSHAYTLLHQYTLEKLSGALGEASVREIMFHEIVNYLRLTPYKLRHSPTKGLAFFGCTSILLRDYLEAYGGPR